VPESTQTTGEPPWPLLFAPVERLGWTFNNRDRQERAFTDPRPVWGAAAEVRRQSGFERWLRTGRDTIRLADWYGDVTGRMKAMVVRVVFKGPGPIIVDGLPGRAGQEARVSERIPMRLAGALVIALGSFLAMLVWQVIEMALGRSVGSQGTVMISALKWAAAVGGAWCAVVVAHWWGVRRYWSGSLDGYEHEVAAWHERGRAFHAAERARIARLADWESARVAPGCRRISIIGGHPWGWQAVLTVFGSSQLTARGPITVLDLSGSVVCNELVGAASGRGMDVDFQLLPTEQADSDLLAGIGAEDLATIFIESLHGGSESAARDERGVEGMFLNAVCRRLEAGGLSPGRIAAGLRAMTGLSRDSDELSPEEFDDLADEMPAQYRGQMQTTLAPLLAAALRIRTLGTNQAGRIDSSLRVVAMSSTWTGGEVDVLQDLAVACTALRVDRDPESVRTLVIVGAEKLAARHLRRLADLCILRDVCLVTMYRHLDEHVESLLGTEPVGFMRLGNHKEAERAANFIGLEHKFVISQLTRTIGGNQTHSVADSVSTTEGTSTTKTKGTGGAVRHWLGPRRTASWNKSDALTWNRNRTWGSTITVANGTSTSEAETSQRVREHRVEAEALRDLGDYGMLLCDRGAKGGERLKLIDTNPEIAALTEEWRAVATAGQNHQDHQAGTAVVQAPAPAIADRTGRPTFEVARGRRTRAPGGRSGARLTPTEFMMKIRSGR
jgi:hypothetical protein